MREADSIEDKVRELRNLLRSKQQAGVSVDLACTPALSGKKMEIAVRARIFAAAEVLEELKPVLRCRSVAAFDHQFLEEGERHPDSREYAIRLRPGTLKVDQLYHLTLHPTPESEAIAQCTVHFFSESVIAQTRARLCHLILERSREETKSSGERPRARSLR